MSVKGERVGALISVDENEINFLGYGTYVGDRSQRKPPVRWPKS